MADPQSGSQNGSIQQGQQQQQQSQPQHTEASQGSSNNGGNLSLPPSQGLPQEASPNSQSQPISNPSQLFSQATASTADTDASLMPPPTPGGAASGSTSNAAAGPSGGAARSSGRAIKPTMKVRGDSEEPFHQRSRSASGSISGNAAAQNYGFRSRKSTAQSASSQGNSSRALRLKLNLKGGHASRGKGDPTLAGVNKTLPYMQGYDRELDSSDDETGEGMAFEEQLILRMPENLEATKMLGEWVRKREVGNDGKEVEFKFKDSRRAVFKMGDKQFSSKLVDLPAIIESHKTLDNKQLFKIADISQMLLVTHQVNDESEVTRSDGLDKVEGLTDDFIYDHGITPPMRWARKRRFRKRIHKRTIETVEKEVERLLAEDERAEDHEYAMIDVAEADMSDSDDEGGGGGGGGAGRRARKNGINRGSPTASLAPSGVADGASEMGEEDDEEIFSQVGEGDVSVMEGEEEDDDVDLDLERELEQEMMLQQQEDEEEEDEEEDESTMGDGKRARGRSLSRATSDDDDEEDEDEDEEEDEDDLFDAGVDEEGGVEGTAVEGGEREDDEDDDDDMDEEEQERRVRETQLEAECKEIEAMVKRKNTELEGTNNALIKQRNLQTLKRMQVELDMKKSQLIDLKQQRKEVKEAAKAEAQAQAQAQAEAEQQAAANAAAAQAAADPARTSSSATPSGTAAAASAAGAGAGTAGQPGVSKAVEGGTVPLNDPSSKAPTSMDIDKDPSTVNSTTKGASNAGKKASSSSQPVKKVAVVGDDSMDVDGEPDSVQADGDEDEDEEDEDEDDDDEDDEDDDLFG